MGHPERKHRPLPSEITHDFRGPIRGITDYLQRNAKPSDVVAITYGDLPIKFYNHLRVVGGLTGEDLTPGRSADWIIMRKHVTCVKDLKVGKYLHHNVDWKSYTPITIDAPEHHLREPGGSGRAPLREQHHRGQGRHPETDRG